MIFIQDRVEIWEAVLTLLFFPILVIVAYAADKGWLNVIFCQVGLKPHTSPSFCDPHQTWRKKNVNISALTIKFRFWCS